MKDFRNAEMIKILETAKITNRNFSGRVDDYNEKGERKFTLILEDPELIDILIADGWNVKTKETAPDEPIRAYLPVFVDFNNPKYLPKIVQVTEKNGKQKAIQLTEDNVGSIDAADIERITVYVKPKIWYNRATKEPGGIKAMLSKMYFVLIPDEVEDLYIKNPYNDEDGIELPFEE